MEIGQEKITVSFWSVLSQPFSTSARYQWRLTRTRWTFHLKIQRVVRRINRNDFSSHVSCSEWKASHLHLQGIISHPLRCHLWTDGVIPRSRREEEVVNIHSLESGPSSGDLLRLCLMELVAVTNRKSYLVRGELCCASLFEKPCNLYE